MDKSHFDRLEMQGTHAIGDNAIVNACIAVCRTCDVGLRHLCPLVCLRSCILVCFLLCCLFVLLVLVAVCSPRFLPYALLREAPKGMLEGVFGVEIPFEGGRVGAPSQVLLLQADPCARCSRLS